MLVDLPPPFHDHSHPIPLLPFTEIFRGENDIFLFVAVRCAAARDGQEQKGGQERKGAPHIVSFAQVLYI
jgi:hypothetical protein